MPTTTSASTTSAQNGSNSGSANERRRPLKSGTGAGRTRMALAPRLDHDPLELLDRLVDDRQRDDRRGEDPVLEVERPLLVHPLVERVDDRVGGDRVVGEAFLEQAGQRRPHHRPVDALLVHQHHAGLGVEERRQRLDVLRRRLELDVLGPASSTPGS